jgi:hypothetical protein
MWNQEDGLFWSWIYKKSLVFHPITSPTNPQLDPVVRVGEGQSSKRKRWPAIVLPEQIPISYHVTQVCILTG